MRRAIVPVLVAVPLTAFIWWIASNSEWTEVTIPVPPKSEAARNPFYAAQRFGGALGARTTWDRVFVPPSTNAVIVLSGWHWSLSARRRERLERWVEGGGRLVVDSMLVGGEEEFERWSGIVRRYPELKEEEPADAADRPEPCRNFEEERGAHSGAATDSRRFSLCFFPLSFLTTEKPSLWSLRDASGIQAVRVPQGQGSVTVINSVPFRYRNLLDGDHGWLFVAATELRRADEVHFLSEDEHPSLLALAWHHGAPAVILTLALACALVWRNAARFGPRSAPEHPARRSLAEQIRGTGRFAWRYGGAESLHAACVRALNEAAQRRIAGYVRLTAKDRAAAISRLTGFDWNALAAAVHHRRSPRYQELSNTIALLEAARRRTLEKLPGEARGSG